MGEKILFVNSEIYPYLPENHISGIGRYLPQGIQERKKEIRSFMPRYGCINERKNQLHEVIRLSGMNIVIDDVDRPLVIKVASISSARMQVYFIDNEMTTESSSRTMPKGPYSSPGASSRRSRSSGGLLTSYIARVGSPRSCPST